MDYHEINMKGRFWVHGGAALPTWHSSYERRLFYRSSDQTLHLGTNSGWYNVTRTDFIRNDIANSHTGTITPTVNNTYNLGSATFAYANVYSTNFVGIATTATYADLAEKYTMPEDYPVGTIVEISSREDFDAECTWEPSSKIIGVISSKPGFLMNSDSKEGIAVGLVGRLPVRIIGEVKKGDPIVSAYAGCGMVDHNLGEKFIVGHALESSNDLYEKLIECFIK